jgi:hypothetical protein
MGAELILASGATLTTHQRTVEAVLRATGHERLAGFARYHEVINRSPGAARGCPSVLGLLIRMFVPRPDYRRSSPR